MVVGSQIRKSSSSCPCLQGTNTSPIGCRLLGVMVSTSDSDKELGSFWGYWFDSYSDLLGLVLFVLLLHFAPSAGEPRIL